ncbi:MAG: NTPase [Candidatus Bathyarchaeia archaeon]
MASVAKRILLVTGKPGSGKTTAILKVAEALKAEGYRIGGMISREVREEGTRVGFEIIDLNSYNRGLLAHIGQQIGPRLGKYRVNLNDLNRVGVSAILNAIMECDIIVIDEIGPMELFSEPFREAVLKAVESNKLIIGVIHWRAIDKLVDKIKSMNDAEVFDLTLENRNDIPKVILKKAKNYLLERKSGT